MVLADTKEGHTGHLVFEKKRFMRRVGQPQEVVRSFVSRRSFRVFSSRRRRWNGMQLRVSSVCAFRNERVVRSKEGDGNGDGDGAVDKERRPKGRQGKCWQSAMIGRTQCQGGRSGAEEEGRGREGEGKERKAKSALTLK